MAIGSRTVLSRFSRAHWCGCCWTATRWSAKSADVQHGPDGLLYLLTDSANGRIIRLEPKAG
jgi:hypothetical protein